MYVGVLFAISLERGGASKLIVHVYGGTVGLCAAEIDVETLTVPLWKGPL